MMLRNNLPTYLFIPSPIPEDPFGYADAVFNFSRERVVIEAAVEDGECMRSKGGKREERRAGTQCELSVQKWSDVHTNFCSESLRARYAIQLRSQIA